MKIVAVTACPSGVAHTFMAKKALEDAAKELGHNIKVETQGAMGIEDELPTDAINEADVAILAIDAHIAKMSRFDNLTKIEVSTKKVLKNAKKVIEKSESKVK